MFKNIKKIFNDKPWREVKTRKIVLFICMLSVFIYTVLAMIFQCTGVGVDSTLTDNVFDFCKWLVVTGCAITIAKVAKGDTNSDSEEDVDCTEDGE
ncbi:hypothetical protein M2140_000174 [Clostridiales Family XIII bacterium PM5-7]